MKLIIAGGRDFIPEEEHFIFLEELNEKENIEEVVSGCAKGADKFGEAWAEINHIPIKKFPADWKKYGKRAGHIRNEQMARYGDALCAFWDTKSRGTKNMIDISKKYGLKVFISEYGG